MNRTMSIEDHTHDPRNDFVSEDTTTKKIQILCFVSTTILRNKHRLIYFARFVCNWKLKPEPE